MTTILLHCAHPVMAAGFQSILAHLDDFTLSPICLDQAELLARVAAEQPDILLLELVPSLNLDTLRSLSKAAPRMPMILWVDTVSVEFASQAIAAGVRGLLRKTLSIELQAKCVKRVAGGELWVEKGLSDRLLAARRVTLSPRERQLVSLLAQGLKNKEIAYSIGITEGTVKVYLTRLFQKVGANDRFELALFALKNLNHGAEMAGFRVDDSRAETAGAFYVPGFMSIDRDSFRTR